MRKILDTTFSVSIAIKLLSDRRGVDPFTLEDFLLHVGGMSIDDAFDKLREEGEWLGLDYKTMGAISDGITLATTRLKQYGDVKKKAGAR